jgi:hypothetical protein
MNAEQVQPTPDASAADQPVDPGPSATSSSVVAWQLPLWLLTLAAGLVSGLISWAGAEAAAGLFRPENELVYPANYKQLSGYQRQAAKSMIEGEALRAAERKKAAASFGLLGLVMGSGLALIGGWVAGSLRTAARAGIGGGLTGAAAGAGLSWAAIPLFFRFQDPEMGLTVLFMTHAAIFIGVGGAAGLALGLSLGDRPSLVRALFGGLAGGFLGTIALETVNSLAFPLMRTLEPIAPERIARLSMYVCVAACTGLFAGLAAGRRAPKRAP